MGSEGAPYINQVLAAKLRWTLYVGGATEKDVPGVPFLPKSVPYCRPSLCKIGGRYTIIFYDEYPGEAGQHCLSSNGNMRRPTPSPTLCMFYRRKALGDDTCSCKGLPCRLPFFFTFIQVYTKTRKIGLHSPITSLQTSRGQSP